MEHKERKINDQFTENSYETKKYKSILKKYDKR